MFLSLKIVISQSNNRLKFGITSNKRIAANIPRLFHADSISPPLLLLPDSILAIVMGKTDNFRYRFNRLWIDKINQKVKIVLSYSKGDQNINRTKVVFIEISKIGKKEMIPIIVAIIRQKFCSFFLYLYPKIIPQK